MEKKCIAVLSGGISSEREVSINSGNQVVSALDKNKYTVIRYDPSTDIQRLVEEADQIDAALIILHGTYGEDGTIQGLLDLLGIPYQGAGVLGSALAMNKLASKRMYIQAGFKVPPYLEIRKGDNIDTGFIEKQIGLPLVVKPVVGGSSIGMSLVRDKSSIADAVELALQYDNSAILEAYIAGIELTGGVIGNDQLEALPIIEIIPDKKHDFFDYEAKYIAGITQEICPARIDATLTKQAQNYAIRAHQALFCRGYSRTDMILKGHELYVLETNTIPGMTQTSLLPLAAKTAGISFSELLDRLIELSLEI